VPLLIGAYLQLFLSVYSWIIIIEVVFSWIPRRAREPEWLSWVREFVRSITEPYLGIFRRIIPPMGGLDFSPLVALLALYAVRDILIPLVF